MEAEVVLAEVVEAAAASVATEVAEVAEVLEAVAVEVEAVEVPKLLLLNLIVTKVYLLPVEKRTLWSP